MTRLKATSGFDMLKLYVEAYFPNVEDFEIDTSPLRNVKPIEYDDGDIDREEIPPLVRWKIGEIHWSYALTPRFSKRTYKAWWPFGSPYTRNEPDYPQESLDELINVIKLSSEGKTSDEINTMIHGRPRP